MNIIFMGTPDFAVPSLKALVEAGHKVSGVFTQPDRPAGRGKALKASPVKETALELGITVFQPEKIRAPEAMAQLKALKPDAVVVVAYGQILSQEILELPLYGCINVHASLLPDWRGAAPIHWSIISGDRLSGVTTMQMDLGLDTGDMLLKAEYPIAEESTTGEVHDALAELGGNLLVETLKQLEGGTLQRIPQMGSSRYASLLKREHEAIDWSQSAREIHNRIRGLNPWPGAYARFREENIKVWKSQIRDLETEGYSEAKPGQVVKVSNEGLLVQTGEGVLLLQEVQPAGKKTMPARDFFLGRRAQASEGFS